MGKREAGFGVVAGRRRIGKSVRTLQELRQQAMGNIAKGVKPRRTIILDINNEYGEQGIRAIKLRDVKLFSMHPIIEIRRLQPFNEDGKKMTDDDIANALKYLIDNFKGGTILLEDLNKYLGDTLPKSIAGAICTVAHSACDLIVHLQSVGRILPKMYQNLSWVRFHKHYESMEECKDKLGERYQIFKITELMVNKHYDDGDIRYYLTINLDSNKIIGNYTKREMLDAIEEYLSINFNKVVTPFANRRDMKGNKKYKIEQAMKILRNKIYLDYYGN